MTYFPQWYTGVELRVTSLHAESVFLGDIFKNGYSDWQIRRALNPTPRITQPDNPDLVAFLCYVGSIFNRISKVLAQHIKSVGPPLREISSFLQLFMDEDTRNIRIPCECNQVYI
jgi:hypothetical protein